MKPSPRLFTTEPLAEGAQVVGTPGQARHLGAVLRRAPGDAVRLFNGLDGEFAGTLEEVRRDYLLLRVGPRLRPQAAEADRWLLFAPLKRDATDLLIRMATELGASALLPVMTDRTNTERLNLDRLAAIAMEAAEQCERLTLPRIDPPAPLSSMLADWPADRKLFAAIERADAAPLTPTTGTVALLIGPEGGFSRAEQTRFASLPFVAAVTLGPLILRAETAAVAGLARLQ